MTSPSDTLVLVTGGSGFVGAHCIIRLLNAGYQVRATLRSLTKQALVYSMLRNGGISEVLLQHLSFATADLMDDAGWSEAVSGCSYILHVASPVPSKAPKNKLDVIIPAREGTLRVLRAAKSACVKRVVLTSSYTAIAYGHPEQDQPFNEEYWTNLAGDDITAYTESKTLAERAAWEFVASAEGRGLELAAVNPVATFGPVLGSDCPTSVLSVQQMLDGSLPAMPKIHLGVVDVRDIAELHFLAMTSLQAAGHRFLAASPPTVTMEEISRLLKERIPEAGSSAPSWVLPNIVFRIVGYFNPDIELVLPELGRRREMTIEKARKVLGWTPRGWETAIIASAESLLKLGSVKE